MKSSQFKGAPYVVYFYPKADTPGCTTQSCAVRDAHPALKKLGYTGETIEAIMEYIRRQDGTEPDDGGDNFQVTKS